MSKKLFHILPVMALAIFLGSASTALAGTDASARGWAWGGGVTNNPPGYAGMGWLSMNNVNEADEVVNGAISYGVKIPSGNGLLSGYAWSEYYGWVSFNESDLNGCPSGACNARREGNLIKGWARITAIPAGGANAGGWSGWIKLASDSADTQSYGLDIAKMDGTGANPTYAWSDELGWIDFSRVSLVAPKTLKVCQAGCNSNIEVSSLGFTVAENEPSRDYRACYNDADGCTAASATDGNVTNDPGTTWTANNNPDDAIDLSGLDPKTITFKDVSGVSGKTEEVSVDYTTSFASSTIEFPVSVTCNANWTYDPPREEVCSNEATVQANDGCGSIINVTGLKNCNAGTNWQEVAP
jgi:hypothetical protein